MKKIYFILSLAATALLSSCSEDFNEHNFSGYKDAANPTNVATYNYTLADADYKTISTSALAIAKTKADSTIAKAIATNKFLQDAAPAKTFIPIFLASKYQYADLGSTARITYSNSDNHPAYMDQLNAINILDANDYKTSWGSDNNPGSFTPSVNVATKLPAILAAKFPNSTDGTYKFVQYNNSSVEAIQQSTEVKYFFDDFETHTAVTTSPYTNIGENGWLNKDLTASLKWQCKIYNSNKYAQATSYKSASTNNAWMISKQIDLTNSTAPKFSFDVTIGSWNADCLTVWISQDFDGTEAGITTATWTEVTSSFTLPKTPTSGYGTLSPAGSADLTSYAGKKVYIGFRYSGSDLTTPKKTTTYQVDNVKVSEVKVNYTTPEAKVEYAVYKYTAGTWAKDDQFSVLQKADYDAIGLNFISTANVPGYISQWLRNKYPYAQEGANKTVVYRSSDDIKLSSSSNFTFTKGAWVLNTFINTKTDQFIRTKTGWVFDPTVTLVLTKVSGNNPYIMKFIDYVIANMPNKFMQKGTYVNEEHYFGFNAYYGQITFSADRTAYGDAAIKVLTKDADKYALFITRLKEAMPIFTQLNFPDLKSDVSGAQQYVIITVPSYYSSTKSGLLTIKMKCTKSGTSTTPAEYAVESVVETF